MQATNSTPRSAASAAIDPQVLEAYKRENEGLKQKNEQHKDDYATHYAQCKIVVSQGAQGLSKHALILGAGHCTAIPLESLCKQFAKVTLVDLDSQASEAALGKLSEDDRAKVAVKQVDLTGCSAKIRAICENLFNQGLSVDNATQQLATRILKLEPQGPDATSLGLEPKAGQLADYVVSSLILTQLGSCLSSMIVRLFKQNYGQDAGNTLHRSMPYMQAISDLSTRLQLQHLDQMREWTAPGGRSTLTTNLSEFAVISMNQEWKQVSEHHFMMFDEVVKRLRALSEPEPLNWVWPHLPPRRSPLSSVEGVFHVSQGSAFHVLACLFKQKGAE